MKKFVRVDIKPESEKEYDQQRKAERVPAVYDHLLRLLAQVCDSAAAGDNTYCTLGTTKDRGALVFTITSPEGKHSIYAGTLGGLAIIAESLL